MAGVAVVEEAGVLEGLPVAIEGVVGRLLQADMSHMEVEEVVAVLAVELARIDTEGICPSRGVPVNVRHRTVVQMVVVVEGQVPGTEVLE